MLFKSVISLPSWILFSCICVFNKVFAIVHFFLWCHDTFIIKIQMKAIKKKVNYHNFFLEIKILNCNSKIVSYWKIVVKMKHRFTKTIDFLKFRVKKSMQRQRHCIIELYEQMSMTHFTQGCNVCCITINYSNIPRKVCICYLNKTVKYLNFYYLHSLSYQDRTYH